jgi:hypothetical protein
MSTKTNYGKSKHESNSKHKTWKPNIKTFSMQDKSVIFKHVYIWNNEHEMKVNAHLGGFLFKSFL